MLSSGSCSAGQWDFVDPEALEVRELLESCAAAILSSAVEAFAFERVSISCIRGNPTLSYQLIFTGEYILHPRELALLIL